MIGKHLSHYLIEAELGRGGMGIVYRARDTKLDRTVAIKVLPAAALTSESDRARFYREAKAAASLTHPHIAIIHGVDEAVPEGASSEELRPFIAMEFVDGDTLDQRIEQGPLKLSAAVQISQEIASALQAAHLKEIVHRDIKSANVILAKDGGAKVLDFGLAQTAQSTKLTRLGSTLGTVSFMSPEQARGELVDHRTDIFSLGVIMYHMISGRLPFGAEYEQAVVYSIMNEDPEPLTAVRTGVPMELERIVGKALAKNREHRYQNAGDLIADLAALSETGVLTGKGSGSSVGQLSSAISMAASKRMAAPDNTSNRVDYPMRTIASVASICVLLTALVAYGLMSRTETAEQSSLDVALITVSPQGERILPFSQAFARELAISRRGDKVAFVARIPGSSNIVLRDLDNRMGINVPGSEHNVESPDFSFDGNQLAFGRAGRINVANVGGGLPSRVTSVDFPSRGLTWLADGSLVIAPGSSSPLFRHFPDGTVEQITTLDESIGENSHRWPHALPDGRGVIFTSKTNDLRSFDDASIFVLDFETGQIARLFSGGTDAMYASGYLVYGKSTGLYAVEMDLESLEVGTEHHLITTDIFVTTASGVANYSVSENRTLVLLPNPVIEIDPVQLVSTDGLVQFPSSREMIWPSVSPTGDRAVFTVHEANDALFILNFQTGNYVRATGRYNNQWPVWAPDGERIAFSSDRLGAFNIFELNVDEPESAKLLYADSVSTELRFWSSDGSVVLFMRRSYATGSDIWMLSMGDEPRAMPILTGDFNENDAVLSPNKEILAYDSDETGHFEVYIRQFPGLRAKRSVSAGSGWRPRFSRDGSKLYYLAQKDSESATFECVVMEADLLRGGDMDVGARRVFLQNPKCADYELLPDGKTVLLAPNSENTPYWEMPDIRMITNWTSLIK